MKGKKSTWNFGSTFVRVKPCEYYKGRIRTFRRFSVLRRDYDKWIPELQAIKWRFKGIRHYKIEKGFLVYQYDKYVEIAGKYYDFEPQPLIFYHIQSGRFYSYRKYLKKYRTKKYKEPIKKLNVQSTFIARQLREIGVIYYKRRG